MPRPPRRPRPAPAAAQASRAPPRSPSPEASNNDRGRTKSRVAGKLSTEEDNLIRTANRNRDAALERLANKDATTGSSGNEREGSSAAATPAHRRELSGLDMADDSLFGDLDASFADGGTLLEGMRSTDTTVLSMSNFRGRSRQSSFIGRNDPPIRPSSRGGTTPVIGSSFNIGAFRRRAREPSILGASRKPLQEARPGNAKGARAQSESASESNGEEEQDDEEDEEDFEIEPEAESTPVNNRRKTRQSGDFRQSAAGGDTSGLTSPRKRKSEDTHHSRIRPEKTPRTEESNVTRAQDSDSELSDVDSPQQQQRQQQQQDSDSELSDLPSPQEPPGFLRRPATPMQVDEDDDEVNAPPASSGSESGGDVWPDIRGLAKKRRRPSITTPSKADNLSDMSSPPSLTHSPNFEDVRVKAAVLARGKAAMRQQQQQMSPKLTTADLTNLLPKRRYKKAAGAMGVESDEELDTAGLGDEDDELSYVDTQAARRRKGKGASSRGASASARSASRGGRAKGRQGQESRSGSDKENEDEEVEDLDVDGVVDGEGEGEGEGGSRFVPLADDTFDEGAAPAEGAKSADELRQASRKFKEVDKWELEFEEVAEASSPQDGR